MSEKNYIYITSNNFVLDTVYKVVIKDNDGIPYVYFYYYKPWPPRYYFFSITNSETNYLDFNLVAHPGKTYNIQLFNSRGKSKIIQLGKKKENISFSLKREYYIINVDFKITPSITVQGDYAQNIEYIYYRNERINEPFKYYNKITGTNSGTNIKIFNFRPIKSGTYYFSYSLYNDTTKFEILNKRIIAGETIMDIALFFPPANTILKTMDYSIDIIPKYTFSMNVFITDSNLNETDEFKLNHLVDFSRKRGQSNYDAKVESISKLNEGLYKFVIQEVISGNLLYTQDFYISDFKFNKSYYIDKDYITIYNT